ncbi:hypothetical protein RRG08_028009 [Elysia crispata]|uniref:Uncharacterized protein n=1 Tax=Elysia crispata TaxID=231223 RepID=A0AAE1BBK2_9GAST|nr:hypothetical protein RRG08_028009 [Elysia crispata]
MNRDYEKSAHAIISQVYRKGAGEEDLCEQAYATGDNNNSLAEEDAVTTKGHSLLRQKCSQKVQSLFMLFTANSGYITWRFGHVRITEAEEGRIVAGLDASGAGRARASGPGDLVPLGESSSHLAGSRQVSQSTSFVADHLAPFFHYGHACVENSTLGQMERKSEEMWDQVTGGEWRKTCDGETRRAVLPSVWVSSISRASPVRLVSSWRPARAREWCRPGEGIKYDEKHGSTKGRQEGVRRGDLVEKSQGFSHGLKDETNEVLVMTRQSDTGVRWSHMRYPVEEKIAVLLWS